jgi:hypothetical protein
MIPFEGYFETSEEAINKYISSIISGEVEEY